MNAEPSAAEPKATHPVADLLSRYQAIFAAAWAHRAELAGPRRLADEAAFLPAALSLQDTPVHPAPRRFAYGLMALFVIAIVWATVGHVDIVATAPGRIIVSDRSKVIQPLEASIVHRVLVKDGDRVQAGQVLVELDPTIASADKSSVQEQLKAAASEVYRTQALLKMLLNKEPLTLAPIAQKADLTPKTAQFPGNHTSPPPVRTELPVLSSVEGVEVQSTQAQLNAEWQDIRAKLAKLDSEANRRQAEITTVKEQINKLQTTLHMAQTREADFKNLVGEGFISSHATQDKTRERVELERDLATQGAKLVEAQSALAETEQTKASFKAETQRQLNDRHALAQSKLEQLNADHSKASQRERQTQLDAPVAGIVQQLAIHSVGGVVTSAQPLMIIVPDSPTVTAEISIANQDIGFVNAGQRKLCITPDQLCKKSDGTIKYIA